MSLDELLQLPEEQGLDDKIAGMRKELESPTGGCDGRETEAVALMRPALPEGFAGLLASTVEGVAEDAEKRLNVQIQAHAMHVRGQAWLSEGLSYVRQDKCPFCAQDLAAAMTLLDAYKAYFSKGYRELRTAIAGMRTNVEIALGDKQIAAFEKVIDTNTATVQFWSRFCKLPPLTWQADADDRLRALREAVLAQLDRKAATPLEKIETDAVFAAAANAVEALNTAITAYNEAVRTMNKEIDAKKASTGVADLKKVEAALSTLKLQKKRHEPDMKQVCDAYQEALAQKDSVDQQKAAARDKLDKYTKTVIGKYEQSINRLLGDFHAGFTITKTEHGYPGGVASSSYQILINGTRVELGDDETPLDQPSFRNTLSAGDKSTLALAFFLAQLEHDPDRTSKIVVFDDPFNSQDNFRKDHTVRKVRHCGESCAQVIVLSHDPYFLKRLWERLEDIPAERKCLEMRRLGLYNTAILEWDVDAATQGPYKTDRKVLTDYYHDGTGEMRHVVQKIGQSSNTTPKFSGPARFQKPIRLA